MQSGTGKHDQTAVKPHRGQQGAQTQGEEGKGGGGEGGRGGGEIERAKEREREGGPPPQVF